MTFVVILGNKTGGPFQIDQNFVGFLYFIFSKLTLCTIRVSLDQNRLQLSCNPFRYKSKKEAKDQKSIQSSTWTKTWERDKNTTKHRLNRFLLSDGTQYSFFNFRYFNKSNHQLLIAFLFFFQVNQMDCGLYKDL